MKRTPGGTWRYGHRRLRVVTLVLLVILPGVAYAFRDLVTGAYRVYRLSRRRDALMQAAGALPWRPAAFRIRGDQVYRPPHSNRRGAASTVSPALQLRLRAAAGELRKVVTGDPVRIARDRAAAALLIDQPADAVEAFESCCRRSGETRSQWIARSNDAELLNDTAAAYDALARISGLATDRLAAIAAATRAHELAPAMPEVVWNYANAIESLGLVAEARAAWQHYIELDPKSQWAREARQKLRELGTPTDGEVWRISRRTLDTGVERGDLGEIETIAARFPLRVKQIVEQQWIPRWSKAASAHDATADPLFRAIDAAAKGIARTTTDFLLSDFIAAARRAPDLAAFAAPHGGLGSVRETLRNRGTAPAIAELEDVNRRLRQTGSPLELTSECDHGSLLYHGGSYDRALQELDELATRLDVHRYPLLAARLHWDRGVTLTALGRVSQSAADFQQALDFYRRSGDETRTGMLQLLIGDNAELTRRFDETWDRYFDALNQVERHGEPDRDLVILDRIAAVALRQEHYAIAWLLTDALVARSRDDDSKKPFLCHALITRCEVSTRVGRRNEAVTSCNAARSAFSGIVDQAIRDRLEADLETADASVKTGAARITALTHAVSVSETRRDVFRLSRVLLLRARAYIESGSPDVARADLEHAMSAVEEQRQRLDSVGDRLSFFETSRAIADELVKLLVDSSQPMAAFQVVDRVRARVLLESMTGSGAPPLTSIDDLRRQLAPDAALIEYWAGPSELYFWIVRHDGVKFFRRRVARLDLDETTRAFVDTIENDAPPGTISAQLSADLIAPVEISLDGIESLTVIPDEPIARVPFGALRTSDGKYLVERYLLTQSPSAAAHLAKSAGVPHRSVLLLASPTTADPLPVLDVRGEIRHAARAIRDAVVYQGADATAAVLRSSASRYDVLHIAAHGFDDSPAREPAIALALARDGDRGLFTASDIARLQLRRGSLVVLAACRGASGRASLEGLMSLARAFETAGARSVVAALWDAGDDDSGRLFSAFYSALATGATPAAALRAAQLLFIHNALVAHPRHWAAYQLYGGA